MTVMNTVCHIELQTIDMDRSQAFYEALFGWTFREFYPGMRVFGAGDEHIGGLMLADKVEAGRSPSIWIKVQNLDDMLAAICSAGGAVASPKTEVPTVGWSAEITDPDGNYVGLVEYSN